ncbi:MAG TPA: MFS transporter [Geminicoccaceae bacterium]|nr:MFS transporter [Geminicoccaceae bacterium]
MLRSHLVPLAAVIVAAAIFQLSNGTLGTLLPVRLGLAEAGELATGLIATAYAGGFVIGCVIGARVIRTVGHIRAFATFAATAAVATLLFQVAVDTALWFTLRVIHGVCIAGLSTVVDSWIAERTPNAARGRVIAIYTITITLALTGSQFMIGLFDVMSAQLIMVVSGLFALALIPVSLTTARTPAQPKVVSVSVRHLYRVAPVAAVGCFAVGFMNTAVMNITPYFLSSAAVPVVTIGLLMGMIQTGRLVMQWPVGWLSDKIDRRLVVLAAAVAIALIMLALASVGPAKGPALRGESGEMVRLGIIALFCLWGAFALTLYAICVAHAQDRGAPGESVGLTSSLLFAWAVGATIGPLVVALLMELQGERMLFYSSAAIAALLAGFTVWRLALRERPPAEERSGFAGVPFTSPVIAELRPENASAGSSRATQRDEAAD